MSAVYVVISTNDRAEVEVVETYAGVQSALGRAWNLAVLKANNPTFVNTSPEEERLEDGSLRWVFLDTNKHFVGVYFKHIETFVCAKNDRAASVAPVPTGTTVDGYHILKPVSPYISPIMLDGYQIPGQQVPAAPPPPPPAAPSLDDDNLPAGWFYDGRPARMKDLKNDPENIKSPLDLTEDEQWALAIARATKRLKSITAMNGFTFLLGAAIADLKARTPAGELIREKEIDWLEDYRCDLLDSI